MVNYNFILWGLSIFGFVFILLPIIIGLIFYLKSFKKRAIIFREIGDDENNYDLQTVNIKVSNHPVLGEIIRFYPFRGFFSAKRFSQNYWSKIYNKRMKMREGIMLYSQGKNYRPIKIKKDGDHYVGLIGDEDNRRFLIHSKIMERARDEHILSYVIVSVAFLMFLSVMAVVTGVTLTWMMGQNIDVLIKSYVANNVSQFLGG